eukprot:520597-Amphidinium_carterae.1
MFVILSFGTVHAVARVGPLSLEIVEWVSKVFHCTTYDTLAHGVQPLAYLFKRARTKKCSATPHIQTT